MSQIRGFLLGAVVGAGITYVLDPQMGRTRRKYAADQVRSSANTAQDKVSGTLDLATDKAAGTVAGLLPEDEPANDQNLVEKVRSEALGGDWKRYTINVDAADGVVTLRGQVDTADHRDAIAGAVSDVKGVEEVENLLHLPGQEPANVVAARRASTAQARKARRTARSDR